MIGKQIEDELNRQVADALNEHDVDIITMIRKFKAQNSFAGEGCADAAKGAFDFACDEIIKIIEQSE